MSIMLDLRRLRPMHARDSSITDLGDDLKNAEPLSSSALYNVMKEIRSSRIEQYRQTATQAADIEQIFPTAFLSTLEYLEKQTRLKNGVERAENILKELSPLQKAMILSLVPETADEAKSLVPGLEMRPDSLQDALDQISTLQRFQ